MAKGSLRVNGIIVDTDGEIKASTGDSIVIREDDGSAVITVDTNGKTSIGGPMDVGVDDTGHDVKFFGATAGAYMLWDESQDDLIVGGAGRVGIGTTAPAVLAHAHSTTTTALYLTTESNSSGDVEIWLGHNYPTSGDWASISFDTGDNLLKLNNSASAGDIQFVINDSGNVGIGTSAPQKHLEISDDGTSGNIPTIRLNSTEANVGLNDTIGILDWKSADSGRSGDPVASIKAISSIADGSHTDLVFSTGEDGTAAAEKVRITSTGNVGIGSTAPSTKLDFGVTSAGDNIITLRKNSNSVVGIGVGTGFGVKVFAPSDGTSGNLMFETGTISTGDGTTYTQSGLAVTFGGNVGIGTSSPDQKFTVDGGYIQAKEATGFYSTMNYLQFDAYHGGDASDGWTNTIHNSNTSTSGAYFRWRCHLGSTTTEHFRIAKDGTLTATDTSIGSNSDKRLKKNIEDYTYSLDTFKKFQPKKFDWKNPQHHGFKEQQIGFVSQDLELLDTRWVNEIDLEEDNLDYSLVTDGLSKTSYLGQTDAMYISVIQQLISKIETLETKINKQK